MAACATGAPACVEVDQALAFVDGQLGGNARAEIERRIDACALCRRIVAEAARGAGAELVRDAQGRSQIVRGAEPTRLDRPGSAGTAPRIPGSDALQPGEAVGRYVVERALGAGGMGVVSLARDPELRRPVVIKLVHPNMMFGEGGDELEARLRREAQAMAQVSHTNVVQIFDIGRRGERVFLAMEFVAGQTLDIWLIEKPRTVDEILAMFRQAAAGLAAAHRAGLVHRDFKPTNVLVDRDGVAKVTDFGLARALDGGAGATRPLRVPRTSGVHAVLTHADAIVGTPAYMAPEQAAGQPIDARTDQYALAVTLLDALLAQWPTQRTVAPTDAPAAIDDALERRGVAPAARAAICKALAEDPAARFPTIEEFARALAPARREPRRTWVAIAAAAVVVAGVAVWFAMSRGSTACVAHAPERWTGEPRARVVAALAAEHRPFAHWTAEHVASAIDASVAAIGNAEVARCQGSAGSAESEACTTQRTAALDAAISKLATPVADPWPWVRAIARCDGTPAVENPLRRELAAATTPEAARAIAERARAASDEPLAADAYEAAGKLLMVKRDPTTPHDFLEMINAGERAADDAIRARGFLDLIDDARWRGVHADAERAAAELDGILKRHGDPRGELEVALAEGTAFAELDDVGRAFAAWDRATDAAQQLHDADATLAAAAGRARSTWTLRWDGAAASAILDTALRAPGASPAARAAALATRADIALALHDAATAERCATEAQQLEPARAAAPRDVIRLQRARGLRGEPDAALAALDKLRAPDDTTAVRIALARAQILTAANRAAEAADVLAPTLAAIRGSFPDKVVALTNRARIELLAALCEAQDAVAGSCEGLAHDSMLFNGLPKRSPLQAWYALEDARRPISQQYHTSVVLAWQRAADILGDAKAEPLQIADLRWRIVQENLVSTDNYRHARLAREAYAKAGRTAEVAAIEAWWAAHPPAPYLHETLVPIAPADAGIRDPWGPQP